MKTLEKHLLILDPLLDELAPLGYFRKGRQLWHVNWQEGYAILIETELYMRGTYKNILIQYGSFWKDVDARSRKPVSLGSWYWTIAVSPLIHAASTQSKNWNVSSGTARPI